MALALVMALMTSRTYNRHVRYIFFLIVLGGISNGAIAGIVIFILTIIVIGLILCFYVRRSNYKFNELLDSIRTRQNYQRHNDNKKENVQIGGGGFENVSFSSNQEYNPVFNSA